MGRISKNSVSVNGSAKLISDIEDPDLEDNESAMEEEEEELDDEDEDYADDFGKAVATVPVKIVARTSRNSLPTKDEQLALRETENLMKTNIVKLQVQEMLGEVRRTARLKRLETFFLEFKRVVASLEPGDVDAPWVRRQGVRVPLENRHSKPVSLAFTAPDAGGVRKVGSYDLGLLTAPYVNMDIAVMMPESCFDKR
jgi:hypothetical protein